MQLGGPPRFSNSNMSGPSPGRGGFMRNHSSMYQPRAGGWHASKAQQIMAAQNITYDGKRMRKAVYRKTVDYNSSVMTYLENRIWQRDSRDQRMLGTDPLYSVLMVPPPYLKSSPMNTVTTKFIRTSTNKIRCPIFSVCWTPEGRRLITGASSGEFTLWNGLTFNFETILQAHDSSVRSMVWSHNDLWMLTADHAGFIKYWQSNMNNVKMYQAHKDPVRGLSFCPTDTKFASCSDDGTVRIWDFMRCTEERILRGHGADVKCVDWHPTKSLLVSGSKDTQQPVKLWDARIGTSLATIHAHKHTVMEVKWNKNGNWLLTASRDHLLKIFDIRKMKEEMQTFKGHKKEATTIAWHPIHESLFTSGGSDGAIMFWLVGHDKEVGSIDEAHETMVWSLAWHPLGHILSSGSNDHTTKFWTRNRVGDRMRDKYNLNTLPLGTSEDMLEYDNDFALPNIPGMGLEFGLPDHLTASAAQPTPVITTSTESSGAIPGLGMDLHDHNAKKPVPVKKVPYAKPIPKNFEAAWESGAQPSTGPSDGPPTPNTTAPPPPSPGPGGWQGQGQGGPVMPGPYGQPPPRLPQGGGRGMQGSQQHNFRQPYQPRGPRPPPPTQQYGQNEGYGGYGQQGGTQQQSGGAEQWGGESWKQESGSQHQQQQGSYDNSYGRGQSYSGSTSGVNGSYGGYNNNRGGTSNGAQGYRGADRGRGRGRGRGGPPPPMGQQQPGSYHDPNQPPSLLDMPMQKRSWEKGPGEDGSGKDWSQGGEGHEDHPAKYSRGEGDNSQDSYQGGQSGGRPPYRGGRGGPPMRGGRGAPFRGRGGPPMRGRGRGGRW